MFVSVWIWGKARAKRVSTRFSKTKSGRASKVTVQKIRMGDRQEVETLINEEALLFAMYLRNEQQSWKPRIAEPPYAR